MGVAFAVGHYDGYNRTFRCIGGTGDGRGGVVAVVRGIYGDDRRGNVDRAVVGCNRFVTGFVGHRRFGGVLAFGQRGLYIDAVVVV